MRCSRGWSISCFAGPSSTTTPPSMNRMRSATSRAKCHLVGHDDHGGLAARPAPGCTRSTSPVSSGSRALGGLVKAEDVRVQCQRTGDGYPLLLPAGELVRVVVRPLRQPHLRQQLPRLLLRSAACIAFLLAACSPGAPLPAARLASITFCKAVYCGKRLKFWNTSPKCSRFLRISLSRWVAGSAASNMVSPFTRMQPAVRPSPESSGSAAAWSCRSRTSR